jgi:hypothetical protein
LCKASNETNEQGWGGGMAITKAQFFCSKEFIISIVAQKLEEKATTSNSTSVPTYFGIRSLFMILLWSRICWFHGCPHDVYIFGVKHHVTFYAPYEVDSLIHAITWSSSHSKIVWGGWRSWPSNKGGLAPNRYSLIIYVGQNCAN